jgi:hypothetical protein
LNWDPLTDLENLTELVTGYIMPKYESIQHNTYESNCLVTTQILSATADSFYALQIFNTMFVGKYKENEMSCGNWLKGLIISGALTIC